MPARGQSSELAPNQQNQNPSAQQNQGSAGQQSQSPTKPAENQNSKSAANSPQELPDKVQPKPGVDTSAQNNPKDQTSQAPKTTEKKKSDRMFYVMPNYLTVDNQSQVPSINWKEKFSITLKGTFDPYEFVIVGVVAGIRQAKDAYPAFGQGAAGYGKRYGAAFADQAIGNIMVGAVFPSILKTDPRYFRLGRGGFAHRFAYAADRIFIARKDSGDHMFNIPEFAGNATAIGISNAYYPAENRSWSSNLSNWGLQMGIDAAGNELKEFWPDIHNRFLKKKKSLPAEPIDSH